MHNIVTTGQLINETYELVNGVDISDVYRSETIYATQSKTMILWHRRLAHLHQDAVVTLASSGSIGILATLSHDSPK